MRTLAVTLLSMLLVGAVSAADPERAEVTKWREDVALLRAQLPKNHANLFHTLTRAQFDREFDALGNIYEPLKSGALRGSAETWR